MVSILRGQCIAHGPVRPYLSDFERFWSDFERNFDDFEQSFTIIRQISRDPLGVGWDAACWQAGERLASLSIDNILLSERLSKYWKKEECMPSYGGSLGGPVPELALLHMLWPSAEPYTMCVLILG